MLDVLEFCVERQAACDVQGLPMSLATPEAKKSEPSEPGFAHRKFLSHFAGRDACLASCEDFSF
jgi:hypothetical protein